MAKCFGWMFFIALSVVVGCLILSLSAVVAEDIWQWFIQEPTGLEMPFTFFVGIILFIGLTNMHVNIQNGKAEWHEIIGATWFGIPLAVFTVWATAAIMKFWIL